MERDEEYEFWNEPMPRVDWGSLRDSNNNNRIEPAGECEFWNQPMPRVDWGSLRDLNLNSRIEPDEEYDYCNQPMPRVDSGLLRDLNLNIRIEPDEEIIDKPYRKPVRFIKQVYNNNHIIRKKKNMRRHFGYRQ